MIQRGPIWGQLETNMVLQIEKRLFFLGFSNTLTKPLKAIGKALEHALGRLGKPLGTFLAACPGPQRKFSHRYDVDS